MSESIETLRRMNRELIAIEMDIDDMVRRCRSQGESWDDIADALGIQRTSAYQRFTRKGIA
ncbi:hypothetical protein SEA_REYNAULD_62 [Rhodococcus phage Reynauld]|uniref:Uncharacterized protein n=1 Tax=Rhodococcus phage Reynauld TaxID=3062845 RepID=A0ACD4UH86_9CAUD|nr:hypothetical protein SEA_REYNAULD_62 [Rhodococcus phage Reynauld]